MTRLRDWNWRRVPHGTPADSCLKLSVAITVICCGAGERVISVKNYIAAIDQGATSTRFMVFDQSARIAAVAQKEHEQIFSKPGWVEHDPLEILRRTKDVIAEALIQETTALGAAYAGGLAGKFFSGLEELRANWAVDRTGSRISPKRSGKNSTSNGRKRSRDLLIGWNPDGGAHS
jgi:glycerol kinase